MSEHIIHGRGPIGEEEILDVTENMPRIISRTVILEPIKGHPADDVTYLDSGPIIYGYN